MPNTKKAEIKFIVTDEVMELHTEKLICGIRQALEVFGHKLTLEKHFHHNRKEAYRNQQTGNLWCVMLVLCCGRAPTNIWINPECRSSSKTIIM
jgi:hypothetical protein